MLGMADVSMKAQNKTVEIQKMIESFPTDTGLYAFQPIVNERIGAIVFMTAPMRIVCPTRYVCRR